jgi:hypothetical protein
MSPTRPKFKYLQKSNKNTLSSPHSPKNPPNPLPLNHLPPKRNVRISYLQLAKIEPEEKNPPTRRVFPYTNKKETRNSRWLYILGATHLESIF